VGEQAFFNELTDFSDTDYAIKSPVEDCEKRIVTFVVRPGASLYSQEDPNPTLRPDQHGAIRQESVVVFGWIG